MILMGINLVSFPLVGLGAYIAAKAQQKNNKIKSIFIKTILLQDRLALSKQLESMNMLNKTVPFLSFRFPPSNIIHVTQTL